MAAVAAAAVAPEDRGTECVAGTEAAAATAMAEAAAALLVAVGWVAVAWALEGEVAVLPEVTVAAAMVEEGRAADSAVVTVEVDSEVAWGVVTVQVAAEARARAAAAALPVEATATAVAPPRRTTR